MDEVTEEQLITAKFAAVMLGGELSDGPPPPGSPLAHYLAIENPTSQDVRAIWAQGVPGNHMIRIPADGCLPRDESGDGWWVGSSGVWPGP